MERGSMTDPLKRIEERHWCHICDKKEPDPCDMVKLARALDQIGKGHAVPDMLARRILNEVAGGSDD